MFRFTSYNETKDRQCWSRLIGTMLRIQYFVVAIFTSQYVVFVEHNRLTTGEFLYKPYKRHKRYCYNIYLIYLQRPVLHGNYFKVNSTSNRVSNLNWFHWFRFFCSCLAKRCFVNQFPNERLYSCHFFFQFIQWWQIIDTRQSDVSILLGRPAQTFTMWNKTASIVR